MKKYQKAEVIAKNLPSGSYAAGCPTKNRGSECFLLNQPTGAGCVSCERTK
jgi:hypothetical protein